MQAPNVLLILVKIDAEEGESEQNMRSSKPGGSKVVVQVAYDAQPLPFLLHDPNQLVSIRISHCLPSTALPYTEPVPAISPSDN